MAEALPYVVRERYLSVVAEEVRLSFEQVVEAVPTLRVCLRRVVGRRSGRQVVEATHPRVVSWVVEAEAVDRRYCLLCCVLELAEAFVGRVCRRLRWVAGL